MNVDILFQDNAHHSMNIRLYSQVKLLYMASMVNYKPWCFYRNVLMLFRDNINIGSSGLILMHASPISGNTSEFIL